VLLSMERILREGGRTPTGADPNPWLTFEDFSRPMTTSVPGDLEILRPLDLITISCSSADVASLPVPSTSSKAQALHKIVKLTAAKLINAAGIERHDSIVD
jgi:hypothetical protein